MCLVVTGVSMLGLFWGVRFAFGPGLGFGVDFAVDIGVLLAGVTVLYPTKSSKGSSESAVSSGSMVTVCCWGGDDDDDGGGGGLVFFCLGVVVFEPRGRPRFGTAQIDRALTVDDAGADATCDGEGDMGETDALPLNFPGISGTCQRGSRGGWTGSIVAVVFVIVAEAPSAASTVSFDGS